MATPQCKRLIILGAAGRDFHDFNVYWRDRAEYEVVCFTAAQIPDIDGRVYPPALSGPRYPSGIPIYPESALADLIAKHRIDLCTLAYSDLAHEEVMHIASCVLAAGAGFHLLSPRETMIASRRPVIAVCAVRTGCGKSQTTRAIVQILKSLGKRAAVVRHPMPYGDLSAQIVQRFGALDDLDRYHCTIEEREEYEPHIAAGSVVFAGIDYQRILHTAEAEADVILWDGGNNDLPFFVPDLLCVVADPHRPSHERRYHPGETNLRLADAVLINKVDTASPEGIATVRQSIAELNPRAVVIECDSPLTVAEPGALRGKRVLAIEDGPTVTHGEMPYGAAALAARQLGAASLVNARPYACGSIRETLERYPRCRNVLPAMGYSDHQIAELERTIGATPCDVVLIGTPVDLGRMLKIDKPTIRVTYELRERKAGVLRDSIASAIARAGLK